MEYLNFSWILEGSLAASQGPTSRRDLIFLKMRDITSVVRMEEQTISAEALEMHDLYEPVPDFTAPTPGTDRAYGAVDRAGDRDLGAARCGYLPGRIGPDGYGPSLLFRLLRLHA